jgi:hypothetical protein
LYGQELSSPAISGEVAVGTDDGAKYDRFGWGPIINGLGQVAFSNYLGAATSKDEALFVTPDPRSQSPIAMHLVAREGYPAPDTGGANYALVAANYTFYGLGLSHGGQVVYVGGLTGAGVTSENLRGIWAGFPGSPHLVVRQGDPVPGGSEKIKLGYFAPGINAAGQITFGANYGTFGYTGDQSVWRADPKAGGGYTLNKIADINMTAPDTGGAAFRTFNTPSIAPDGTIAFKGTIFGGNHVIYTASPTGVLTKVAESNTPAPGTDTNFGALSSPLISSNGNVAFTGQLTTDHATLESGIWAGKAGALKLIAREEMPAPVPGGGYFNKFDQNNPQMIANSHGQVAFRNVLVGTAPGEGPALFATDREGQLVLVAQYGQSYEINPLTDQPAKQVSGFFVNFGSNSDDGHDSAFNDLGQIAMKFTFGDGTEALVRAQVPFPGDADDNNLVDYRDFRILHEHFGQQNVGRNLGDFNYDNVVNFADFQLLERWLGKSASDEPVGISPAQAQEVAAFAAQAPEPAGLAVILLALAAGRRRHARA